MLKNFTNNRASRKTGILVITGCIFIAWLGTLPFIESGWMRFAVAMPCGLLLGRAFNKWLKARRLMFVREQFKWLLEHLLSKLSAGATLEHAFIESSGNLGLLLGRKSELLEGLKHLEHQLLSHQPLNQLLSGFGQYLPCTEAQAFFRILPEMQQSGGNIIEFVRYQLRMIVEQLALQQDLNAETVQRQTEAMILTVLPFGMAGLLRQSEDLFTHEAVVSTLGQSGMLLSYILAMSAAMLTVSLIRFDGISFGKGDLAQSKLTIYGLKPLQSIGSLFRKIYKNLLPEPFGAKLLQMLQEQARLSRQPGEQFLQIYFQTKAVCIIAGLLPGSLMVLACPGQFFWPIIFPVLFCFIQDQRVFSLVQKQHLAYQMDYPVFLNLAAALLQAGVSLYFTLNICLKTLYRQLPGQVRSPIGKGIQHNLTELEKMIQIGVPVSLALEKIAAGCSVPEVQSALLLMVRYDRDGGPENLELLQMQTTACWAMYRNALRKQLERQSLKLLLPMTLDLASVMLTAILPAIQSLQSI